MTDTRPDPEQLLRRLKEEESRKIKGRLKIFFGAAAGVGKTYAMLISAKEQKNRGVNVIAGLIVTHGRKETEALLDGLEIIPPIKVKYKGTELEELDLDSVIKRNPQLVLVDELAHTNAPGLRHEKRWQDIQELLDMGINVFSTLNIQHLESFSDIVAQITGIAIRETVPDVVIEQADELEIVDLPPDDLIQRLKDGKVYLPERSQVALNNFFRKGNLIALRELALRATAQRVDTQMQQYRSDAAIKEIWPASERILVCISPAQLSARLVRAGKRLASALKAQWLAVYVETPHSIRFSDIEKERIKQNLRLAEQLGAQTTVLSGIDITEEIITYSKRRNVSKIIVGKPAKPRWRELLFGSTVDSIVRNSGDIDVYVITGGQYLEDSTTLPKIQRKRKYRGYVIALMVMIATTLSTRFMLQRFQLVNLAMIYMASVVFIATRFGRGPSILATVLGVLSFDYFYLPPLMSSSVYDVQYLITSAVMLAVGSIVSNLTFTAKLQAETARKQEEKTAALYAMTRQQASALSLTSVLESTIIHLHEVFECKVAIFIPDEQGGIKVPFESEFAFVPDTSEIGVAQWVLINGQIAGACTSTLPGAKATYFPLKGSKQQILAVLGIQTSTVGRLKDPEQMHMLEIFSNQVAVSIERATQYEIAKKQSSL